MPLRHLTWLLLCVMLFAAAFYAGRLGDRSAATGPRDHKTTGPQEQATALSRQIAAFSTNQASSVPNPTLPAPLSPLPSAATNRRAYRLTNPSKTITQWVPRPHAIPL